LSCSLALPIVLLIDNYLTNFVRLASFSALICIYPNPRSLYLGPLIFFYGGALLHRYGDALIQFLPRLIIISILAISLLLYCILPRLSVFPVFDMLGYYSQIGLLLPCMFVVCFVAFGKEGRLHRILLSPRARFLGQISFSVYLLHYPLVRGLWFLVLGIVYKSSLWLTFVNNLFYMQCAFLPLVTCVVVFAAYLSRRYIELPTNHIGHNVARTIASSRPLPAR
jgi:peptidoglycan/LPS O-acetylase OafA/YrhL